MKPIKCPNCGKRMVTYWDSLGEKGREWEAACACESCGVRGPEAMESTKLGAERKAVRLTREWIARMEADKVASRRAAWIRGKIEGLTWAIENDNDKPQSWRIEDLRAAIKCLENGGGL